MQGEFCLVSKRGTTGVKGDRHGDQMGLPGERPHSRLACNLGLKHSSPFDGNISTEYPKIAATDCYNERSSKKERGIM